MAAMIQNDAEKDWMLPMLRLRSELDFRGEDARKRERGRRDFRRMSGKLTFRTNVAGEDELIHGPYKQDVRAHWLKRLLETQQWIRKNGPKGVRALEMITSKELVEIRRIWVTEKHEVEDLVPKIYEEIVGEQFPETRNDDSFAFGPDFLALLREAAGQNELHFELTRNLLDIERRYRGMASRRGLYGALEEAIVHGFYENEEDALGRAKAHNALKQLSLIEEPESGNAE
jgi:DNA sulfur modification protein DndC